MDKFTNFINFIYPRKHENLGRYDKEIPPYDDLITILKDLAIFSSAFLAIILIFRLITLIVVITIKILLIYSEILRSSALGIDDPTSIPSKSELISNIIESILMLTNYILFIIGVLTSSLYLMGFHLIIGIIYFTIEFILAIIYRGNNKSEHLN